MMKFQIFSDTHFEANMLSLHIQRRADNLILAGDISTWTHASLYEFLDYASKTWNHTFYVPGNHEFYCVSAPKKYSCIDADLKQKISNRYTNVYYLNNDMVWLTDKVHREPVDGAICIIGSILWSNPPDTIEPIVNDFKMIYTDDEKTPIRQIKPVDAREWNKYSIDYIKTSLANQPPDMAVIVITHFPPIYGGSSSPQYAFSDRSLKQYFTNQLDYVIYGNPQVKLWVFGHTHYSNIIEKGQCRLVTNAIGHQHEHIIRNDVPLYDMDDQYSCVVALTNEI